MSELAKVPEYGTNLDDEGCRGSVCRMTVIIGALCADSSGNAGHSAVVAADRMLTNILATNFSVETDDCTEKLQECGGGLVALVSGNISRARKLLAMVIGPAPTSFGAPRDIPSIAARLAEQYVHLRQTEMDSAVFGVRGMQRATFYGGGAAAIGAQLANALDAETKAYNLDCEILLIGTDARGAHLWWIGHPGGAWDWSSQQYVATGGGHTLARLTLDEFRHRGATTLEETAFRVYAARMRGTAAPGVGTDGTDMAIVEGDKTRRLSASDIEELEKLRLKVEGAKSKAIGDGAKALSFFAASKG